MIVNHKAKTRVRRTRCCVLVIALSVAMLASVACSRGVGNTAAPFPASHQVTGWVKTGDTRTFSSTELWNYIDGDAERYVKAGVQSTSTADYNYQSEFDAVPDIYTMGNAQGARTILESEPASQAKSVQWAVVFQQSGFLQRAISRANCGL
jgi:hypothetical protein